MSKYIRTDDGIYEVDFVDISTYYHTTKWNIVKKEQIIAQADTIEELCDEFVGFEDGCIPFVWRFDTIDKYRERDLFIKEMETEEIIYGAIWTEWGLRYVAKMNEKGELELV